MKLLKRRQATTGGCTHIFLHVLRFDSLVGGVRRVERPKGKAAKTEQRHLGQCKRIQ